MRSYIDSSVGADAYAPCPPPIVEHPPQLSPSGLSAFVALLDRREQLATASPNVLLELPVSPRRRSATRSP